MSYRQRFLPHPLGPLLPPVEGHGGHAVLALGQAVNEVPVIVSEVEKSLGAVLIQFLVVIVLAQVPLLENSRLKIKTSKLDFPQNEYLALNVQNTPLPLFRI